MAEFSTALLLSLFIALFLGPICTKMCFAPVLFFTKGRRREEEEWAIDNANNLLKARAKETRRARRRAERIMRATADGQPPPVTERRSADGRCVSRELALNPAYMGIRSHATQQEVKARREQQQLERQVAADRNDVTTRQAKLWVRQQRKRSKKKWASEPSKEVVVKASEHLVAQIQTAHAMQDHAKEVEVSQHFASLNMLNRKLQDRRETQFANGYTLPPIVGAQPEFLRKCKRPGQRTRRPRSSKVHPVKVAPHLVTATAEC